MSCPSMMMRPPASPIILNSAISSVVLPLPVRPTMPICKKGWLASQRGAMKHRDLQSCLQGPRVPAGVAPHR